MLKDENQAPVSDPSSALVKKDTSQNVFLFGAVHLPYELVVSILSYLKFRDVICMTRVSKRWKECVYSSPSLWRRIQVPKASKKFDGITLASVVKRCAGQMDLFHLEQCYPLTSTNMIAAVDKMPFRSLTQLKIVGMPKISTKALTMIVRQARKTLTTIDFSRMTVDTALITMVMSCSTLNDLVLSYADFSVDITINSRAKSPLKRLDLAHTTTRKSLLNLLSVLSADLEYLNVNECSHLDDTSLSPISRLKRLKALHCNQISHNRGVNTADLILQVVNGCSSLSSFSISHYPHLNELACDYLAEFLASTLTYLDLSFSGALSDACLSKFKLCTQLTFLNITHCSKITDTSLVQLFESCPKLEKLGLSGLLMISDTSIEAMKTHCKALTHLNVAKCTRLSGPALVGFIRGSRVKYLNVNLCQQIEERFLAVLRDLMRRGKLEARMSE